MKHHCNRDLFVSELNDLLNNPEIQRMAGYEQHQGNTTLQHVLNVAMVSFRIADRLGLDQFFYMGASHGAGVGWHLLWKHAERIRAFIAMVPGPHSLEEGVMSYRQMLMQGLIDAPPPFDPPIDHDPERKSRRRERQAWLDSLPEPDEREKRIDYGRPLMSCGTEKRLREVLSAMQTPTLILGGMEDPISTPELMLRTAGCLPHCKLVVYSNCGHNLDTEMPEELAEEADRFLKQYSGCGWSRKTMTGI